LSLTRRLKSKKPVSACKLKRVARALAEFITRPQAEIKSAQRVQYKSLMQNLQVVPGQEFYWVFTPWRCPPHLVVVADDLSDYDSSVPAKVLRCYVI
jgi:hypothetical protein